MQVLRQVEGVRTRSLPEWAGMLAYTPQSPNVCYMNTTAAAVYELSQGLTFDDLFGTFNAAVPPSGSLDDRRRVLADAVTMLREKGIIEEVELD